MVGKYSDKYKTIGRRIQYYRKQKAISQQELADIISVSKSYIAKIEAPNCDKSFSLEILFEISDALQIPISKFFD